MLTISQLASYSAVTVRTVRFYHHKGLLPEPQRDRSGYRRYGAQAVVELIRIRTLADAGVPLARVRELLVADPEDFAAAIEDIDRRLRAEMSEKREQRRRIAELAAGDSLALPPEATAYLDHLRELGLPDRLVRLERDAWILVAAQLPEQMPTLMALKRAQLDSPAVLAIYHDLLSTLDWEPDDQRLPQLADRLASFIDASAREWDGHDGAFDLDDDLVDLLDSVFLESLPVGHRLLELLEERGWKGWTRLERVDAEPRVATSCDPVHERSASSSEP